MDIALSSLSTDFIRNKFLPSIQIIKQTLQLYKRSKIAFAFNGGKDWTVIYYLLQILSVEDINIWYFKYDD